VTSKLDLEEFEAHLFTNIYVRLITVHLHCTKLDLAVTDLKIFLLTFEHVTSGPMTNSLMTNRPCDQSSYDQGLR